eukprot:13037206-Alexandrium_andersonii.AAC.1
MNAWIRWARSARGKTGELHAARRTGRRDFDESSRRGSEQSETTTWALQELWPEHYEAKEARTLGVGHVAQRGHGKANRLLNARLQAISTRQG